MEGRGYPVEGRDYLVKDRGYYGLQGKDYSKEGMDWPVVDIDHPELGTGLTVKGRELDFEAGRVHCPQEEVGKAQHLTKGKDLRAVEGRD